MLSVANRCTFNRWVSIFLYAFFSPIIVVVLSKTKWIKELFDWWVVTFNYFDLIAQCFFSFIVGFLLHKWLGSMYVNGKKSSVKELFNYPPITMSVIFSIFISIGYSIYITGNKINILFFIYGEHTYVVMSLISGFVLIPLRNIISTYVSSQTSESNIARDHTPLSTYDEYKEWFKDDKPISDCSSLSYELQEYVIRIKERIESNHGTGAHIALFGKFGTGKSSIIKCVQDKLSTKFIFSNIDTWGTDSNSINGVVLAKVISDVSSYVDVSALKGLPSQYIDALKIGGNPLKLLAIFSGVSVDPKAGLIKLDNILATIDKKLIITIQDLDRSSHPSKSCNELSALLDKLKELKNISFIVALGYDSNVSEAIRKVCDYREDLITVSYQEKLFRLFYILTDKAKSAGVCLPSDNREKRLLRLSVHKYKYSDPYMMITSERSLKHICRRVDAIWQYDKLMGEIDIESLFLFEIIREEFPLVLDFIVLNKSELINELKGLNKKEDSLEESFLLNKLEGLVSNTFVFKMIVSFLKYFFSSSNKLEQGVNERNSHANYFERILLGNVPSHEIRDQDAIKLLTKIGNGQVLVDQLISNFKNHEISDAWIFNYIKFNSICFKTNLIYVHIYMEITEFYYFDTLNRSIYGEWKINSYHIQMFIYDLLKSSLTKENAVQLFKQAVKVPATLWFNGDNEIRSLNLLCSLSQSTQEEICKIFLSELKVESEILKQLPSQNANITSLMDLVGYFIHERLISREDIVLALIENNSKSESTYKLSIWSICYILKISRVEILRFTLCELNKIKKAISELNDNDLESHINDIEDKDTYRKGILEQLEKKTNGYVQVVKSV